jgi:hypothetical protein
MTTWRTMLIALSLGVAGCAAYGGVALLEVSTDIVAPSRGVVLSVPDAIQMTDGIRFHGWVCRKGPVISPTHIRLERVSGSGEVLDSVTRTLGALGGRRPRCSVYDVPTDWRIAPDERVRVCALRNDASCATSLGATPAQGSHNPA